MAKSTYLQLVNRAVRECGVSGGDLASVTGQTGQRLDMVNWVADADLYVQRLWRDWDFLHTSFSTETIASTKDYTKPTNLNMWDRDSFFIDYGTTNYVQLFELDYVDWRNNYGASTQTTAKPGYFVIKPGGDIILFNTPDDAYTLTADYWKNPTKLSANTDTSNIPEAFEDIIIHRAKVLYAEYEEAGDMLNVAVQEFDRALMDLEASYAPAQRAKNISSFNFSVQVQ